MREGWAGLHATRGPGIGMTGTPMATDGGGADNGRHPVARGDLRNTCQRKRAHGQNRTANAHLGSPRLIIAKR